MWHISYTVLYGNLSRVFFHPLSAGIAPYSHSFETHYAANAGKISPAH